VSHTPCTCILVADRYVVQLISLEKQGKQRDNVVRGANLRFEQSLAQLIEFAKLSELVDNALDRSIDLVVARMISQFADSG
jgi:hypothetical protein